MVATGGGSVLRERNRALLRRNGLIIWLNRPLSDLPSDGRPLSLARGVAAIFEEREPIYRAFADRIVVSHSIEEAVGQILGEQP